MNVGTVFKALQYFKVNGLEVDKYWEDSFTLFHTKSGTKSPTFYSVKEAVIWAEGFVAGYSAKGK